MHLLFETNDLEEAYRVVAALKATGIGTFLGGENMHSMAGLNVPNVLGVYVLAEGDLDVARRVLKKLLSQHS